MSATAHGGLGAGASGRLSRHAQSRAQQRAIPRAIIDALVDFGERRAAGNGAEACFFTKRSWRHFASYLGKEAKHFERYRDAYAVVTSDGQVITACWRH